MSVSNIQKELLAMGISKIKVQTDRTGENAFSLDLAGLFTKQGWRSVGECLPEGCDSDKVYMLIRDAIFGIVNFPEVTEALTPDIEKVTFTIDFSGDTVSVSKSEKETHLSDFLLSVPCSSDPIYHTTGVCGFKEIAQKFAEINSPIVFVSGELSLNQGQDPAQVLPVTYTQTIGGLPNISIVNQENAPVPKAFKEELMNWISSSPKITRVLLTEHVEEFSINFRNGLLGWMKDGLFNTYPLSEAEPETFAYRTNPKRFPDRPVRCHVLDVDYAGDTLCLRADDHSIGVFEIEHFDEKMFIQEHYTVYVDLCHQYIVNARSKGTCFIMSPKDLMQIIENERHWSPDGSVPTNGSITYDGYVSDILTSAIQVRLAYRSNIRITVPVSPEKLKLQVGDRCHLVVNYNNGISQIYV